MLREMRPGQLREWKMFSELEPFDNDREDFLFGSIVQVLLNVHRKKGTKPVKLEEAALLFGDRPRRQQNPEWLTALRKFAEETAGANRRKNVS